MPYDGPGGYCRVIYDLCTTSRSESRVAVFGAGDWTRRLRRAGVRVFDVLTIMAARTVAERVRRLDELVGGVDLLNVHIGPVLQDAVRAFPELVPVPAVYTLHWPQRLPVSGARIICTSRALPALQRPSNRCYAIENGVDVTKFRPAPRPPRHPVIVRLCRPARSAHYFWDAVEPVLRRHPEARLWILGEDGTSTPQIKYWGYRDDVPALLRKASILAYAPRPDEGAFDLSILEAMASGVVPIVTDVACTGGAVTSGKDGVLVPYGDVLAFEAAIERAVGDPRRTARLAKAARRTARDRYDVRATAAAYDRTYASILDETRPRARRARTGRAALTRR